MERMLILTPGEGVVDVEARGGEPSVIGSYWNATRRFLATGDESVLDDFRGVVIDGYELETGPDEIEYCALTGELDIQDIYES